MIYVYKTTNTANGKYYIGVHEGELDDLYLGSGKLLKRALQKFGRKFFKKEILKICQSREEAYAVEKELVNEELLRDPNCYNLIPGGDGGDTVKFLYRECASIESQDSDKLDFAEKTKQRMKRLHDSNRGKPLSEEAKRKVSEYHLGRKRPKSTGKKISQALTGKEKSESHKQKLKIAALARDPDSEETKKKKSESSKKRCENGFDMGFMRGKQYQKTKCEHCDREISVNAIARHLKTCKENKNEKTCGGHTEPFI